MTSLNTALKADYTEMVNHYLDRLPIENTEEFESYACALKVLLKKESLPIPETIKSNVQPILDLLEHPSLFVQDKLNFEEFRQIVRDRIASKINDIGLMTLNDKQKYIQARQQSKKETQINHAKMKQYERPAEGSERHVEIISPEALFWRNMLFYYRQDFLPRFRWLNEEQMAQLPPETQWFLITQEREMLSLLEAGAQLEDLSAMNKDFFSFIFNKAENLQSMVTLLKNGANTTFLKDFELMHSLFIMQHQEKVIDLLKQGNSFKEITSVSFNTLRHCFNNWERLMQCFQRGVTFRDFQALDDVKLFAFFRFPEEIIHLMDQGKSFQEIFKGELKVLLEPIFLNMLEKIKKIVGDIDLEKVKEVLPYLFVYHKGTDLLLNENVSLETLVLLDPEQLQTILSRAENVIEWLHAGISLQKLLDSKENLLSLLFFKEKVVKLMQRGITFDELAFLNPTRLSHFLFSFSTINDLLNRLPFKVLIEMDEMKFNTLLWFLGKAFEELIDQGHISAERLLSLSNEHWNIILFNYSSVITFVQAKGSFEYLANLEVEKLKELFKP